MKRLLLLAFIWGWSFLFIKVAVEGMPPTIVAGGRVALGAAVLWLIVRARGVSLPLDRRSWRHFSVAALLGNVLPFTMLAWGEERITSALTAVLNASTPLFAAIAAAVVLQERLRAWQAGGLVLGMVGVAVAAGIGGADVASSSLLGGLASVAAGACYGATFAYMRLHLVDIPPLTAATGQLLAATVLSAPMMAVGAATGDFDLAPRRILSLVLLGVVGTGLAYIINYRVVADLGATRASLVTYVIPVVAVIVGIVVLHERFHARILVGGVLIVAGVALVHERLPWQGGGRWRRAVASPAVRSLLLLAGVAAFVVVGCGGGASAGGCSAPVSERLDPASGTHLLTNAEDPDYATDPPTSGPHLSAPVPTGVLGEPLSRPAQVTLLERGTVLLQHDGLPTDDRRALEDLAGDAVTVAPNPDLPAPVVATAWTAKQTCDTVDTDALRAFVDDHRGRGPADH